MLFMSPLLMLVLVVFAMLLIVASLHGRLGRRPRPVSTLHITSTE